MSRNWTLSGTGLGLFLIALGVGYFTDLATGSAWLYQVFRFYPVLAILLGLDYILSGYRASSAIHPPQGWIVTVIILITIGGLTAAIVPRMFRDHLEFRGFDHHFMWSVNGARSEREIEKSYSLPSKVKTLRIENNAGEIRIEPSRTGSVTVNALIRIRAANAGELKAYADSVALSGETAGDEFRIRIMSQKTGADTDPAHITTDLRVTVPNGVTVTVVNSLGDVRIDSIAADLHVQVASGTIHVERAGGNLTAVSDLGSIEVGTVAGDARLTASAGEIRAKLIQGAAILENSLGGVKIDACDGPVKARLRSGGLTVNFRKITGPGDLEVDFGSAVIGLPQDARCAIDAATSMGDIHSDFPLAVKKEVAQASAKGELNGGGPLVRIKTSSGSILLRKASYRPYEETI